MGAVSLSPYQHPHRIAKPAISPLGLRRGRAPCPPCPLMGDSSHLYTPIFSSETHTPLTSFTTADWMAGGAPGS